MRINLFDAVELIPEGTSEVAPEVALKGALVMARAWWCVRIGCRRLLSKVP